jgi:hypothetical protein
MSKVNVMISIDPCCERIKFLADILAQARSLNLNEDYQLAIENCILDLMGYVSTQDADGIIQVYESKIDNLLELRDTAFNEWKDEVKNRLTPIPKLPIV